MAEVRFRGRSGRPVRFSHDRVDTVGATSFAGGSLETVVPGDLRLRAVVAGYAPLVLSPILDSPTLYRQLLGGIRSADLADPTYYGRLRQALDRVELHFALTRL